MTYLSTAMATKVKTEAETDIPCTSPLILHMLLPNGHPGWEIEQSFEKIILIHYIANMKKKTINESSCRTINVLVCCLLAISPDRVFH